MLSGGPVSLDRISASISGALRCSVTHRAGSLRSKGTFGYVTVGNAVVMPRSSSVAGFRSRTYPAFSGQAIDAAGGWLHTLPGAIAVAAIVATLGRKPSEMTLRWWNERLSAGWQTRWLTVEPVITKTTAWASALIGTVSHIALDSIMHTDVKRFGPL